MPKPSVLSCFCKFIASFKKIENNFFNFKLAFEFLTTQDIQYLYVEYEKFKNKFREVLVVSGLLRVTSL